MMLNSTYPSKTDHNRCPHNPPTRDNTPVLLIMAIAVIGLLLSASGCASQSSLKKSGMKLYHSGDYDHAVEYFQRAVKEKPSRENRLLLFRSQLASYYNHLAQARSYRDSNQKEQASKEYEFVLKIFPNNKKIQEEYENYIQGKTSKPEPFYTSIKPPVHLRIDTSEKISVKLTNTPITKIFNVVGKSYGVNFIFDKDFRDFVYTMDIDSIGFYDILNQLCLVGSASYRVMSPTSILIYPNTTFKKRTFSLRGVKVYYLSNIKAEEAKKMLMNVFRDQQILAQEDANLNSLIIKADYTTLQEIERFIYSIDKRKSEVVLDVEILEVTKNFVNAVGINYGDVKNPVSTLSTGVVDKDGNIDSRTRFEQLDKTVFFLTIPSAALSFLESDDNTKVIARPNLRGLDAEEIKFMVGDEVPYPQTTFQSFATGGVQNVPLTTYQYKNVGVEAKVTPYIHRDGEVTLKIKLTINSISGYQNDFPIFGKRELENIIRLKEGETNIIGGFIREEMRHGSKGFPAVSRLPILKAIFGASGKTNNQTDVVFSITPRVIHHVDINEYDKRTIWSEMEEGMGDSGYGYQQEPNEVAPPPGRQPHEEQGNNSVIITPMMRRTPAGRPTFFSLRLNSSSEITSLSLSGTVSGGNAVIEELQPGSFGGKVDVVKNFSGSSFDLGFTFHDRGILNSNLCQLRILFKDEGNYTINITSINAMMKNNQPVQIQGTTADVEVKGKLGGPEINSSGEEGREVE